MNAGSDTATAISLAVAALGPGALREESVARHVAPLFSKVLDEYHPNAYFANHSLGRPLDATAHDVAEAVTLWQSRLGDAWDAWSAEIAAYRRRLAQLLKAPRPDCVVPKTSAGQGLRTILNSYEGVPRVVATRGEFDSIDLILRQYALRGRVSLRLVEPRGHGLFESGDLLDAIGGGADLVVVSHVLFNTGQMLPRLAETIAAAHDAGARVIVDVYHSLGVFPVDIESLDADFAIGGSYKYLRGGPGAAYLYIHPRHLDGSMKPLDIGWFAKKDVFQYRRPDPPEFGAGGDAFLESTPPVLTYYQARAGQLFTLAIGVERLREYSLSQQRRLVSLLDRHGIPVRGGSEDRGAFTVVSFEGHADGAATQCAEALAARGVICDARGPWLRLCPEVLNGAAELDRAAETLVEVMRA